MVLIDSFFPPDRSVTIWGAGANGGAWLAFLRFHGVSIAGLVDKCPPQGDILGMPVTLPDEGDTRTRLLVSPVGFEGEIAQEALALGWQREDLLFGRDLMPLLLMPRVSEEALSVFPPFGHFYSLYPEMDEVARTYESALLDEESGAEIDGLDMQIETQLAMLGAMNELYPAKLPWKKRADCEPDYPYRYVLDNNAYDYNDGLVLHFMMRRFQPKRIIEIGCGNSSAVILDTNELCFDWKMQVDSVEPYPKVLHSVMKEGDAAHMTIYEKRLQDLPLSFFDRLEKHDILFIDTSHVTKYQSDVNHLFFHVLPRLASGVIVHLHDIFYPWEYPKEWILRGMGWNEMYLLRAFLAGNRDWEILFATNFMEKRHREAFRKEWREEQAFQAGSFWMRKR